LFLDSDQFYGDVFGGDADDFTDFFVAHVLQPKQDDCPIEHPEFVDAAVKHLHLPGVVVGVGKQIDVHCQRQRIHAAFLFPFECEAGVQADAPDPRLHVAFALKAVESAPQVDERLLKQVVHLILVL